VVPWRSAGIAGRAMVDTPNPSPKARAQPIAPTTVRPATGSSTAPTA
jgi:hypothetical protein